MPWSASRRRAWRRRGREEADVVLERVGVGQRADLLRAVAPPREAGAIAVLVGHHAQRPAALLAPGVERRVDVDDVEGAVGQAREDVEVVAVDEQVVVERDPRRKLGGSDDLHAHDVMDTPGCGRVRQWYGSTVHARRRLAAMVLLTLLGAALIVVLDRRGGGDTPQSALGAERHRRRGRGRAVHLRARRSAPPTSATRRSASATCSTPRAPAASWPRPGAPRTGGRSSTASPARHRLDADMLEAIVMLEIAPGAPTRAPPTTCARAAGLTQILAETGQNLLGLRIDVKASERLTRGICAAHACASARRVRRRVDERFDPAKAIEATARYLDFAKGKLGRDDLAVVSYHMGVGNLQQALMAYGKGIVPYAQLYFDSSPLRHAAAWRKLAVAGRRLLDLPVARARGARDHAPVPRPTPRRSGARRCCSRTRPRPRRSCTRRTHAGLRRPVRGRPRARVGRAARDRPGGAGPLRRARWTRAWASSRGASSSRRACTARCARRRWRCSRPSAPRRARSRAASR